MTRARSVWIAVLGVAAVGGTAAADSPYELDPRADVPVFAIGAGLAAMALIEVPPPGCFPDCSPDRINALDRTALGHYSETAHSVADVTVLGLIAAPLLIDAIDSGGDGFVEDTLVFGQAVLLAQALTQLTKFAVRRTAPFVYDPNAPESAVRGADAPRSFFSGHMATASAASAAYTTTYFLRHPENPWRFAVLGSGIALSLAVGVLKVLAGYHFWTDVAAGALVGAGVGTLVPYLHEAR